MAKKNKNPEIIFDFANEEDIDVCGFSDKPIKGKCIATFSCSNHNSNSEIKEAATEQLNDDGLFDNRNLPIVNGCAPPINGEYLDVKRTYVLRKSTVRKINQLKSLHPDINTYVSTIVDLAIAHYYEHIINNTNIK